MRPRQFQKGEKAILGESLFFLPLPRRFLRSASPDLRDMAVRPFLLMLLFSAMKVIRDAAVDDSVTELEIVLVRVSFLRHCNSSFRQKASAVLNNTMPSRASTTSMPVHALETVKCRIGIDIHPEGEYSKWDASTSKQDETTQRSEFAQSFRCG